MGSGSSPSQQEMKHGGVAGGHHFVHLRGVYGRLAQQLLNQIVKRFDNVPVQLRNAVFLEHGMTDARDHIGSVDILFVQGRVRGRDSTAGEVDQNPHHGRRSNVQREAIAAFSGIARLDVYELLSGHHCGHAPVGPTQ